MFEALAFLSVCTYFYCISKWWHYIEIPSVSLALLGVVVCYFLPESPRFLVSQNRFDEARKVFGTIAKHNGVGEQVAKDLYFKEEMEM